jgi:CheY-like chemotaxis protein
MRFGYDLYSNIRPVKALADRLVPLKGRGAKDVDFVVFRENTEGIYAGMGGQFKRGTPDEVAINEDINTRKGVERIIRAAFEYARSHGKKRLTMADKSNAMRHAHELWLRVFNEVRAQYPEIESRHVYVDALCLYVIQDPSQFDVIVTNNLFGDIVTDLGAALQGGLGMAASANIHASDPARVALFEPVHGSAPPSRARTSRTRSRPCCPCWDGHAGYEDLIERTIASALERTPGTWGVTAADDGDAQAVEHHDRDRVEALVQQVRPREGQVSLRQQREHLPVALLTQVERVVVGDRDQVEAGVPQQPGRRQGRAQDLAALLFAACGDDALEVADRKIVRAKLLGDGREREERLDGRLGRVPLEVGRHVEREGDVAHEGEARRALRPRGAARRGGRGHGGRHGGRLGRRARRAPLGRSAGRGGGRPRWHIFFRDRAGDRDDHDRRPNRRTQARPQGSEHSHKLGDALGPVIAPDAMAVSSAAEREPQRTSEREPSGGRERLGGARADFVANLGKRRVELRGTLDALRADPSSKRYAGELRRRVHALAAGAKLLRFSMLADELKLVEAKLEEAAHRGSLEASDFGAVHDLVGRMTSLAWGQTEEEPVAARSSAERDPLAHLRRGEATEAASQRVPCSVLVVGGSHLADPLSMPMGRSTDDDGQAFEVERTAEASVGLDLARALAPDVAVIDGDLPDAKALVQDLAADPLTESVPIIVALRLARADDAGPFLALGVARVLPKPVSPSELRRACAGRRLHLREARGVTRAARRPHARSARRSARRRASPRPVRHGAGRCPLLDAEARRGHRAARGPLGRRRAHPRRGDDPHARAGALCQWWPRGCGAHGALARRA